MYQNEQSLRNTQGYKLTQTTTRRGSAGTPYIINSMDFTSFVLVADPLHSYRGVAMSETISADERGEELLRVLCLKDTIHILRHLKEHDEVQFIQFAEFVSPVTLQRRLRQLLRLTLIEHHLEREGVRKEWYEFTEKGRKVLQILENIIRTVEDEEHIGLANIYKNIENSENVPRWLNGGQ